MPASKPGAPYDLSFHFMGLETDWLEAVGDDDVYLLGAHIDNGQFGKNGSNAIELTILQKNTPIEALAWGGLAVFSNIKKATIRKAFLVGLEFLVRTQQFSAEDIINVAEESDE